MCLVDWSGEGELVKEMWCIGHQGKSGKRLQSGCDLDLVIQPHVCHRGGNGASPNQPDKRLTQAHLHLKLPTLKPHHVPLHILERLCRRCCWRDSPYKAGNHISQRGRKGAASYFGIAITESTSGVCGCDFRAACCCDNGKAIPFDIITVRGVKFVLCYC